MQSMGRAVEGEILGSEHVALYGLDGPRPCRSEGHRVGAEKARYCGMDCAVRSRECTPMYKAMFVLEELQLRI